MPSPAPVTQPVDSPQQTRAAVSNDALRPRLLRLGLFLLVLTAAFFWPLLGLLQFARHSELYSYILLVPFVSAYLIWLKRTELSLRGFPISNSQFSIFNSQSPLPLLASVGIAVAGFLALIVCILRRPTSAQNYLALTTFAYVSLVIAGSSFVLGRNGTRQMMFPFCFLLFMVPFPTALENGIEMFFQYTSADVASFLFTVTGTPIARDGLTFQAPSITLRVAQECSGIRSSLVLFITSLIAGYMFLRSPWRRATLTLAVIPLAIVRNAFRIWVLATLCHYIDPSIIRSPLHKRGGPLFFALSLIPFFALLLWLWRSERKRRSIPISDR